MTTVGAWAADAWVLLRPHVPADSATAHLLGHLLHADPPVRTVQQAARLMCCTRRTLDRRLARDGDITPVMWVQLVRTLRAAQLANQHPHWKARRLAHALGYDSEFTLSNSMVRHLGVRISEARGTPWQLLLLQWLRHQPATRRSRYYYAARRAS